LKTSFLKKDFMNSIKSLVFTSSATLAVLVLGGATSASAIDFKLNSITGSWSNPSSNFNVTGIDTNEVRWGTPFGTEKSGLRFDGIAPPSVSLSNQTDFVLGQLTDFNFVVTNPINSVDLNLALNLDGVATQPSFKYTFNIDETSNGGNVAGCPSFQQSNVPCDDRITFPSNFTPTNFSLGGQDYTLQLVGFSKTADGSSPISQFITQENISNTAYLVGRITTPSQTRRVSEPTMLFGLSAFGLYTLMYRLNKGVGNRE
jgi:hypothetical protein